MRYRRRFGLTGDGIGFPGLFDAARPANVVFIMRTRCDARDEQFPNAGKVSHPHRMSPAVPGIEIADDCDACCIGRPYRKANAADAIDGHGFARRDSAPIRNDGLR